MKKRLVAAVCAAAVGFTVPVAHAVDFEFESLADSSLGINDPSCEPSGEVREPVVLLHGTSDNSSTWNELIPVLQEEGMCVWAFDYGADDVTLQNANPRAKAIADLDESAREIAGQIDYVREVTGSDKVNLVGHSQGGLHIKTYTQMYGSAEHVSHAVAIGGNLHGTTLNGMGEVLAKMIAAMPHFARFLASSAGIQQVVGSEFMENLNALPDTAPGPLYTSIYSPADVTVTPNSSSMLTSVDGADVVNIDLGELCGAEPLHPDLPRDPMTMSQVLFGLTREAGQGAESGTCVEPMLD
ncbi:MULTISPECIES: triacylglycerol lipase [Corynebacterium]|uniref:esterase/lipase family protein n=1 Tax=Corynebacterium TaxID=1716 RepID=UPI0008A1D7A3|nr:MULTISPECIES: alpha/beta fold hydrolase [Corynebacterium]OFP85652.1 triacylglycerol lipase [Corynebacterium sp. HMSC059E07]TRX32088.1 alpha/beta fold hydrolase [Corynebacterium guaraldiae]